MSLLERINLVLGLLSAGAAVLACYVCWTILEGNARREVLAEAGLAKHLVKRAASLARDRADLIARSCGELDAESDRAAFAQRCQQPPIA